MCSMLAHRKNYYSQFGEDGIIEYLTKKLGIEDNGVCCEFGAWDGKHISNTFHLIKNRGFSALYIEADEEKYKDLLETCKEFPKITPVHERVDDNLDDIFERHQFPFDIDVLSIDIDSTDYDVWRTTLRVNPKIVIIEPDSSIPAWIKEPIYPTSPTGGANYFILEELGTQKGYTLACNTSNMIFVRNDLITTKLELDDRIFPWHLKNGLPADAPRPEYLRYRGGMALGYMDQNHVTKFV